MRLIAGLGNPGPRYERTRHNVGFAVVDELARRWRLDVSRYEKRFEALAGGGPCAGQEVLLLKPQTLMNLSGRSVLAAVSFYKLAAQDVLIVFDDLDLPVGRLRIRPEGTAGGHRGMGDILARLGRKDVPRMRIGIGRVHRSETVGYVLGRFAPAEQRIVDLVLGDAADAVELWLREGVTAAMNRYNPGHRAEADGAQDGP